MSRRNQTEAQGIGALKQLEAGRKAEDVVREQECRNTPSTPGKPSTAGCEPGAGSQAVTGREHEAAKGGNGSESAQGSRRRSTDEIPIYRTQMELPSWGGFCPSGGRDQTSGEFYSQEMIRTHIPYSDHRPVIAPPAGGEYRRF